MARRSFRDSTRPHTTCKNTEEQGVSHTHAGSPRGTQRHTPRPSHPHPRTAERRTCIHTSSSSSSSSLSLSLSCARPEDEGWIILNTSTYEVDPYAFNGVNVVHTAFKIVGNFEHFHISSQVKRAIFIEGGLLESANLPICLLKEGSTCTHLASDRAVWIRQERSKNVLHLAQLGHFLER